MWWSQRRTGCSKKPKVACGMYCAAYSCGQRAPSQAILFGSLRSDLKLNG